MMLKILASALLLAGCGASSSTAVPVSGKDPDVALLAGKWAGEYEGRRHGTISFDLELGYHTAEGQVIMQSGEAPPVPLKIKFVKVGEGKVSGKIAPYTDPDCNCTVETEFTGFVEGGSMSGTFITRVPDMEAQTGTWSAQRSDH